MTQSSEQKRASEHTRNLLVNQKLPNGDIIMGWVGHHYGSMYSPRAVRITGAYGWGFKISIEFDGVPKIYTREQAVEVTLKMCKVLENLPDWLKDGAL